MSDRLSAIRERLGDEYELGYLSRTVMVADIRWLLSIAEAAAAYREAETAWDVGPSDVTYRAMDDAESRLFAALDEEPSNG